MSVEWRLVSVFAVLSVLGFGGGKGIFPQMRFDTVNEQHWVTAAQFAQFYTIGKLVPGPTTIMCALVGYSAAGVRGAAIAAAAMFVPASVLMLIAGALWDRWRTSPVRDALAHGLAPVVIGLTWASVFAIGRGAIESVAAVGIALVATALTLRTKIAAPLLIVLSGVAGFILLR